MNFNLVIGRVLALLRRSPHHHYHSLLRPEILPLWSILIDARTVSIRQPKGRLRISRYVDDHKIAGNALGWSLLMQSTRCTGRFHRSFHYGYLPRVRGFIAFFRARNFSSSEARLRTCFNSSATNEKGSSSFSFPFIPLYPSFNDWSIQIACFHHVRELYPPRKMFNRALTRDRPQIFPFGVAAEINKFRSHNGSIAAPTRRCVLRPAFNFNISPSATVARYSRRSRCDFFLLFSLRLFVCNTLLHVQVCHQQLNADPRETVEIMSLNIQEQRFCHEAGGFTQDFGKAKHCRTEFAYICNRWFYLYNW